jgi:hypothetical protein
MQRKSKVEAPSRTGYQGTAKKRLGATTATSRGHGAPASRGATRGRGRGRGRGQEPAQADTFSFIAPNNDALKPKRKRSLANAILNAPNVESSKSTEHFKTPSMVRKAELAARSLADRAPDMQSVGPLSRPSDYGGGRPVRKRSQILSEDSEMAQNNQSLAAPMDDGSNTTPIREKDQEKALLASRESQLQTDITERTSQIDLYKTNTPNQIAADADYRSRGLPEGVPTGPRALIQEQASTAARQLEIPDSDVTESTVQPLRPSNVENSVPAALQTALIQSGNTASQPTKPVTKMNLKEYKSRRKSEFLGDAVPAQAIFGSKGAEPMVIGFTDIDKMARPYWAPMLGGLGVLNFSRTCVAQEFQTQMSFLQRQVHANGNIITGADGATILEDIAEWLRPCSGLIFIHEVFSILVFPARCEEWKFLDANSDIDHRLRYQIYEPNYSNGVAGQLDSAFAETIMSSLDLKHHYLETLVDLTQNLQYQALLPSHPEGQDVHNFYLFFPRKAASSAKYIVTWLRACNRDCRIYTNQKSGSWDIFTNNPIFKAGTIIIHEYLLPSISKIPRLSSLINGNAHFSFWCMDDGSCANPFRLDWGRHDAMPSYEASVIRLFPHGGAVFLTPSFLTTQPERTYDLLKWFHRRLSSSTPGTWKLVVPNECPQYLLDLAVEKASERDKLYSDSLPKQSQDDMDVVAANQCLSNQECNAMFQSYVILDQLLKNAGLPDYWEEEYPDDFESPVIYADENIDQNDEKALVSWFAGWTMLHLNLFRKFIVVGTTPLKRRAHAPTTKSTVVGIPSAQVSGHPTNSGVAELEKGPVAGVVQEPPTPQTTGPPVAAAKKSSRNAFSEVKDLSSPMVAPPLKATTRPVSNEILTVQNRRIISQSGDVEMDVGSEDANPRSAFGGPYYKHRDFDSVSRNSPHGSRTRHGIDENQPPSILEFIAITGRDAETAKRYLARYNGDVHTAVQRYWHSAGQSSSPQRVLQMDGADDSEDPASVVDFIAGTDASAQVAERYLHLAQEDVRRAIALYNESQQYSRSPSSGLPNQDRLDEREGGHGNSPSRSIHNHATSPETVHRRCQTEEPGEKELDVLDNLEPGESPERRRNSRKSLQEIERDLNVNSANDVPVIESRLLVKVAELSHEKIFRTLPGESIEEVRGKDSDGSEDAYDPDQPPKERQIILGQQRDIAKEFDDDQLALEADVLPSYDGADERQREDGSRLPRRSGIVTSEVGTRQFVPRSVRPSGTTRPEISIRPGYVPLEDTTVYKNRRVVGGIPQYEAEDVGNSSGGSRNNSTVQSPASIEVETRRQSLPDSDTPLSTISKRYQIEPNFETTVEWYEKLRKNGQGWEHIYVGGWESCFPRLHIDK